ncbi:hypothetical protein B4Q13_16035, partial [Lacticaseibacillus rhamnosus]
ALNQENFFQEVERATVAGKSTMGYYVLMNDFMKRAPWGHFAGTKRWTVDGRGRNTFLKKRREGIRHARHDVCPRLRGLPACAPGPQFEARKRRQGDAGHRRRDLRDGARVQGLALRRAWRRAGPLRIS